MRIFAPMRAFLAFTLCICLACHGTEPKVSPIAGTWSGFIGGTGQSLTLSLVEKDGQVSGTGQLSRSTGLVAQTVTGTWFAPNLTATLASTGFESVALTASITSVGQLAGTLNGSGFVNAPFALGKQ